MSRQSPNSKLCAFETRGCTDQSWRGYNLQIASFAVCLRFVFTLWALVSEYVPCKFELEPLRPYPNST